jgi:hypothetical protein
MPQYAKYVLAKKMQSRESFDVSGACGHYRA